MKHLLPENCPSACAALRKRVQLTEEGLERTVFKIAATDEERTAASRVVHDVYVKRGYADPSPNGARVTKYDLLPGATTFIAVNDGRVIATVMLYTDSAFGIPMDSLFKPEVDQLRKSGSFVAEVGSLVSLSRNQNVMMHLIKALLLYAYSLKVNDVVITVNPRHRPFYEYVLVFDVIADCRSYPLVKNNPAIALRLNLRTAPERTFEGYPRKPLERDLHHFFFVKKSSCIILPPKISPVPEYAEFRYAD